MRIGWGVRMPRRSGVRAPIDKQHGLEVAARLDDRGFDVKLAVVR
ncbi:hypothetical protein [Nocardia panacis]|nr:hypothetical protein [Nocardia panacis]